MKYRKRQDYYEGYMTIEATFVVPIAVMIIVLLLYCGFYCYDKSVSVQCCYLAALRASNEWDLTSPEMEELADKNMTELVKEKFLFITPIDQEANAFLTNIEVGVSGKMDILVAKLNETMDSFWRIESQKDATYIKPSSYIRRRK